MGKVQAVSRLGGSMITNTVTFYNEWCDGEMSYEGQGTEEEVIKKIISLLQNTTRNTINVTAVETKEYEWGED